MPVNHEVRIIQYFSSQRLGLFLLWLYQLIYQTLLAVPAQVRLKVDLPLLMVIYHQHDQSLSASSPLNWQLMRWQPVRWLNHD